MTGTSDQERQDTLDRFDEAVNMTAGELEKWLATDQSREVGQKDGGAGVAVWSVRDRCQRSHPHEERGEGDGCLLALGRSVVSRCDAAPLLQLFAASFDAVAALVELLVERRWTATGTAAPESVGDLVSALGDGMGDVALPQSGADRLRAVPLVADDVRRPDPGTTHAQPGRRIASNRVVH